MSRLPGLVRGHRDLVGNVVARVAALASLAFATFMVARIGGPAAVGAYALLRVLPGLVGVLISCGLPGAVAYFLAGPTRIDTRLRSTIVTMALVGGCAGTLLWGLGATLIERVFFPNLDPRLVVLAGMTVLTQLLVATAKSCSQGSDDLRGANYVIVLEEFMFLPGYGLLLAAGVHGNLAMIAGLLMADISTFVIGWYRLGRRGFFQHFGRPSLLLAKEVAGYGLRAQIGGALSLLNLRLDFVLLDAFAGPAVLGPYAIASKFAELLRLLPMSLSYVLYPRYARSGPSAAASQARALIPRAALLTAVAAVPLWVAATYLLPVIYGPRFASAVAPAHILLIGLAAEGAAGVITAFLYGIGRPGLNSLGMAAGVAVTVALDLVLIPRYGAVGAAWASSAAYLTSTLTLCAFFWTLTTSGEAGGSGEIAPSRVGIR